MSADSLILVGSDERIRALSWDNLRLAFTSPFFYGNAGFEMYRPLTTLSYLFNYAILGNGPDPTGYHILNFCLHLGNVFLVWAIARLLLTEELLALAAALLFALHPVNVEAVTNLAGRSDLMMGLGVLGGLYLHARGRIRGVPAFLAMAFCGFFAVYSKETGVILFPALVLYDFLLRRQDMPLRVPAYAGAALAFLAQVVTRWFISRLPQEPTPVVDNLLWALDYWGRDFWTARATALEVIWRYLKLLSWPSVLSTDYSYGIVNYASLPGGILAAAGLAGLLALCFYLRNRNCPSCFYGVLFFLALAPVSNLFLRIGTIMAERLLYLPSVGFAGVAAVVLWQVSGRISRARQREIALVAFLAVAGLLGWRTWLRNPAWHDGLSLAESALAANPNSFRGHLTRVLYLHRSGLNVTNIDRAIQSAERARDVVHSLPPHARPTAVASTLGALYRAKGELIEESAPAEAKLYYARAIECLLEARRLDVENADRQRAADQAKGLPAALVPSRGNAAIYENLMLTHRRTGRIDDAYEAAVMLTRLLPDLPQVYLWAAELAERLNRQDERAVLLWKASALTGSPETAAHLAAAYSQTGLVACLDNASGSGCVPVQRHKCLAYRELAAALRPLYRFRKAGHIRTDILPENSCPADAPAANVARPSDRAEP